jgi:hypothetical protein
MFVEIWLSITDKKFGENKVPKKRSMGYYPTGSLYEFYVSFVPRLHDISYIMLSSDSKA